MQLNKKDIENGISHYKYIDFTSTSILESIQMYPTLSFSMDEFKFPNDINMKIACLEGPFISANSKIMIVRICLMPDHPESPPICYARKQSATKKKNTLPTSQKEMNLPPLKNWDGKLVDLIEHFITNLKTTKPENSKKNSKNLTSQFTNDISLLFTSPKETLPKDLHLRGNEHLDEHNYFISLVLQKISEKLEFAKATEANEKRKQIDMQNALLKNQSFLSELSEECIKERDKLIALNAIMQSKKDEVDYVIQQYLEEKRDIDTAVEPTTPLYKQLFDAFTEVASIEDAEFNFRKALQKNIIQIHPYLRTIKELSTKKFFLIALMQKIRIQAGLPI